MEAHFLPVETLLEIFSHLELKPYIISHGVCKDWRRLLPLADIHPIRRRLFELYQNMINTPHFLNTRPWIIENLQPFDRHAHVDALLAQIPAIPEEYRIWVLEWPARAVIACIWPGLPFMSCHDNGARKRFGVNWLAYKRESPELMAPIYKYRRPGVRFTPALLTWRDAHQTDWLSFDTEDPTLFGRVYISDIMAGDRAAMIPDREPWFDDEGASLGEDVYSGYPPYGKIALSGFHPDWISYLEYHWTFTVEHILDDVHEDWDTRDVLISEQEAIICFNTNLPMRRPTFPWNVQRLHTAYLDVS